MSKTKAWISAFRLRTLPLALASIFLGSLLAAYHELFRLEVMILTVLTTIFLQVLSNLANDYGDFVKGTDNDQRVGPERAMQSGALGKKEMLRGIVICSLLALGSGIALIIVGLRELDLGYAWLFLGLGLLSIAAAIKYTMGKNAYGYHGLGDLMVFLFFGITGVLGTYFMHTNQLDWTLVLPAVSIGLLSSGVLNLNNMRDRVNDKASGKNTIVVRMGGQRAKYYHSFLLTGAVVSALAFVYTHFSSAYQLLFLAVTPILALQIRLVILNKDPKFLDPELKKLALTTLAFALLFGAGHILTL